MKRGLLIAWVCLGLIRPLSSTLIIKQDKEGNLYFSNTPDVTFPKKIKSSSSSLSVPKYFKSKIKSLADQYQMREDLVVAVIEAESGFNPFAVSAKGATGIMQLMKDTAQQYGINNRFNAEQNMEGGIRHLKYLYDKYDEDIPLTLAAYNAGEEAVAKYDGVPPYSETRTYIRRVMGLLGLSPPFHSPTKSKKKIYKYTNSEGRIVITDTKPSSVQGELEIID